MKVRDVIKLIEQDGWRCAPPEATAIITTRVNRELSLSLGTRPKYAARHAGKRLKQAGSK